MKYFNIVISAVMLAVGMIPSVDSLLHSYQYLYPVWFLIAYAFVGINVMREAVEALRHGDYINEFTLMVVASTGAFFIEAYGEGVGVMLFYAIGEAFQDRAVGRVRADVRSLLESRKGKVRVVEFDGVSLLSPENVHIGSIVEVVTGERLLLDGVVVDGSALIDTSFLTGESVPRSIGVGEEAKAGFIVTEGVLRLRTVSDYRESAIARMIELVESAENNKSKSETFIRRFSKIYTPAVVVVAMLLVIVPYLLSLFGIGELFVAEKWIYRAVLLLTVSCPCALVVSVPLSYFAGIGAASRHGVLFKGGVGMDTVSSVTSVVFDKTGTLTDGRFDLLSVEPFSGTTRDYLLSMAASIEASSNHPVAKAIVVHARKEGVTLSKASEVKEYNGGGMEGSVNGVCVTVGTTAFLAMRGVDIPVVETHGRTTVACACDGLFVGFMTLGDRLRKDAAETVRRLRQNGVSNIAILSGDKEEVVESVASELGVNGHGGMSPENKMEYVQIEMSKGNKVAFVGDGINDAPVMACADLSVAMGGSGSDVAVETADVVIETDDPSKMVTAIKIGRAVRKTVKQNIIFALTVKGVVLLLGAIGAASVWSAVFADVGVSLLAVINAMRLLGLNVEKKEDGKSRL